MNAWVILLLAGICETGWPLGFKLASVCPKYQIPLIIAAAASMALSGVFLYMAQKTIPISTAYAVWTGIGGIGTFLIGVLAFGDAVNVMKCVSVFMIFAGLIGLKIF